MRVKWTRRALDNLDSAVDYIAVDKPTAAADAVLKILNAVKMLADQPGMGRPGRVAGTRELVVPSLPYTLTLRGKGWDSGHLEGSARVNEMAQQV